MDQDFIEHEIECIVREITGVAGDTYEGFDEKSAARQLTPFIKGIIASHKKKAEQKNWTDANRKTWLVESGPQDKVDETVLAQALQEWYRGLDDERRLAAIQQYFDDDEIVQRWMQKHTSKSESELAGADEALYEVYQSKKNPEVTPGHAPEVPERPPQEQQEKVDTTKQPSMWEPKVDAG